MNQIRLWFLPPTRVYFLLKDLFSQTLHKICEKHCHSIYYTLYCRSCGPQMLLDWLPFRNTSRDASLWWGRGRQGRKAVLGPFFPFCSELPLLFGSLRICGFFFPLWTVIFVGGRRWVAEWCRGFSNKRVKWYFYHINFNYSILYPVTENLGMNCDHWPCSLVLIYEELTSTVYHVS